MPDMIMTHRSSDVRIATTTGFSYLFKPGTPVSVHESCVEECQSKGAAFLDPDDAKVVEGNVPGTKKVLSPGAMTDKLVELFVKMRNNTVVYRQNFTAGGRPSARWVAKELGFEVTKKQFDDAWDVAVKTPLETKPVGTPLGRMSK